MSGRKKENHKGYPSIRIRPEDLVSLDELPEVIVGALGNSVTVEAVSKEEEEHLDSTPRVTRNTDRYYFHALACVVGSAVPVVSLLGAV